MNVNYFFLKLNRVIHLFYKSDIIYIATCMIDVCTTWTYSHNRFNQIFRVWKRVCRVKRFDYYRQSRWRCLHAFRSCLDLHIPLLLAGDTTTSTDVCRHNGKFLKCDSNSVLKIRNVICMPNNYTCPEKNRIVSICEGQRSCENFGIRQQLWTYCQDHPSRTVLVDFKCEPGIILIVL